MPPGGSQIVHSFMDLDSPLTCPTCPGLPTMQGEVGVKELEDKERTQGDQDTLLSLTSRFANNEGGVRHY